MLGIGALVLVLLVVGIVVDQQRTTSRTVPPPTTRSGASIPPSRTPSASPTVEAPSPSSTIVTSRLGSTVLAGASGYELIGYGPTGLVRIRPRDARMIRTGLPDVAGADQGGGQLSLVASRGFVTILPSDGSAGYVVRDGATARHPNGDVNLATFVFPGPDPTHLWVTTSPANGVPGLHQVRVTLVDADGTASGPTLPVPDQGSDYSMAPDGTGYLVAVGTGGYYLARPEGLRRITTGALLATGPTRWLTNDCDDQGRCTMHVVDRASGRRRALGGTAPANVFAVGQISADGRYAAVTTLGGDGTQGLVLFDLATGRRRDVAGVAVMLPQAMTWSPDARWLLVVGDDQVLRAVDPETGASTQVSEDIPPLAAITVRSGSGD